MDTKTSIEIARNILNNAIEMNMSKEIIFKISQRIDQYIVKYYIEYGGLKGGFSEEKNQ
ncbi:aspartyl-phosphate phosphatase Spo0E family protein [Caldicoprobacter algeriensis]|uniref:aspartyl-phosphate phosphatase Spo0E family protein n=1 Tax=Caldicoprobacter algeriensis TaxID=699281 RepID=UPI00207A3077|nr:aspartyl-phosphate phosphatase Spo0E family protein [Caldicoprobacter algeriensis]MCM8900290.1 aspartyl-phosphate phosphatase Spo0E family protein [Caldicoprobacter algeriensis]